MKLESEAFRQSDLKTAGVRTVGELSRSRPEN